MVRYRLTGITAGSVGAQWEKRDDDREIARRILNLLSDRRLLWKDFSLEIEEHCVQSANRIREELGKHLDHPDIGPELAEQVRAMQRTLRDFVDQVGPAGDDWNRDWRPIGTDPLSVALGRLRAVVGGQVGYLAARYDLEVSEELATVVPDEAGWFFTRLGDEAP